MLLAIVFSLLAGIAEGVMDFLNFHYNGVSNFWHPDLSWKNKWENGDPLKGERFFLSSTALVFITDGWHMMKFIRNRCFDLAVLFLCLYLGLSFCWSVSVMFAYRLAFGIGFYLGYR